MQTLKIQIPKGFEIDSLDKSSGEIKFKEIPQKTTDRIRTVTDLLAYHGLTHNQFDEQCIDLTKDEKAYRLLKMLTAALNEGWQPDWSNQNECKYFPWFEMNGSSGFRFDDYVNWASISGVGSRLAFKTRELAEYACQQFQSVYQQFMIIE